MSKLQTAMLAAVLGLSGCAVIQGQIANDSQAILAEAGFTPQRASAADAATGGSVRTLPDRRLSRVTANGAISYEFYDPKFCNCVYVGGPAEYAKLQQLRAERVSDHAWYLARSNPITAAPDPKTWGPWKPEGLDLK